MRVILPRSLFFDKLLPPTRELGQRPVNSDSLRSPEGGKSRVTSDLAERGVTLMEQFNLKLTKDEQHRQYLSGWGEAPPAIPRRREASHVWFIGDTLELDATQSRYESCYLQYDPNVHGIARYHLFSTTAFCSIDCLSSRCICTRKSSSDV